AELTWQVPSLLDPRCKLTEPSGAHDLVTHHEMVGECRLSPRWDSAARTRLWISRKSPTGAKSRAARMGKRSPARGTRAMPPSIPQSARRTPRVRTQATIGLLAIAGTCRHHASRPIRRAAAFVAAPAERLRSKPARPR